MNDNGVVFNNNAKQIAFNDEHYERMMLRYDAFKDIIENKITYYSNLELEKQRASYIRLKAFKKLDKHLVDFDTNFTEKGGKILWANDIDDARQMIYDILSQRKIKRILKTKSSTLEEIGLKSFLEMKKIRVIDTNIGDFICSLQNERPYNTKSSSAHKTVEDIASLYTEQFGIKENCNVRQLTTCTKKLLNDSILKTDALITGANFLVSSTGTVVLTEDEGNILKSTSFSPLHIIVAGIDKMITSLDELGVLLPISSLYEPNKIVSSLYNFINKSSNDDEESNTFLIILNNGRTDILSKEKQRVILSCIQCGACSEVCPIYNIIGGHSYEGNIPGPVGSIISPIKNKELYSHYTSLCALCGRCMEVCPVKIPFKELFIENRKDIVKYAKSLVIEKYIFSYLMKRLSNRKSLDKYKSSFKNFEFKNIFKKKWGNKRELPKFADESFSEYWKKNINY